MRSPILRYNIMKLIDAKVQTNPQHVVTNKTRTTDTVQHYQQGSCGSEISADQHCALK